MKNEDHLTLLAPTAILIHKAYAQQLASSTRRLRTGGGERRNTEEDTDEGIHVIDNSVSMSLPSSILYGENKHDGGSGSSPSRSGKSGKEDNLIPNPDVQSVCTAFFQSSSFGEDDPTKSTLIFPLK